MIAPVSLQVTALLEAYEAGQTNPVEIVETVLARVAVYADTAVWIFRVPPAEVRARAKALAAQQAQDPTTATRLKLFGIPFAVKDNIDVAGMPTTAACPGFAQIAVQDATVVRRLLDEGAILIGKTNLDQFATGLNGTRSPYGAPRCVFSAAHISGGSSSGSAVAVAAGLVSFALGTDTAGSGRVPAAFNNLVGIKPTKGLLSTVGLVPACRSLDCISIFANTVADARIVLDILAVQDPADPYSRPAQVSPPLPRDFRFGVLSAADREFAGDDAAEALYDAAIANLAALGGTAEPIEYAPFRDAAALLYDGPFVAERLAGIRDFHSSMPDAIDPVVRGIIEGASAFSAVDTFVAQDRLRGLMRATQAQWNRFDVMLLPTTPTIFTVAELRADPVRRNSLLGLYTNFVNLLDLAAIAVPAGFRANGLPFGVTLIAPAFTDQALCILADRLHRASGAGVGGARDSFHAPPDEGGTPTQGHIQLAVVGAHMSGMPLNGELLRLHGRLLRCATTAADYQLYALPTPGQPKPGLIKRPGFKGPGIAIEIWELAPAAFGHFAAAIPSPLGLGKIELADGSAVSGFLCEAYAAEAGRNITDTGGWRAYRATQAAHPPQRSEDA